MYLLYPNDAGCSAGLMSHPRRTFRGKRHASGYPLGNYNATFELRAFADPSSLYISPRPLSLVRPLPLSLSFPPLHLSSWIALPTRCAVHPSPCPASALSFPVYSRQRILFQPVLIYPTRSSFGYRRQELSSSVNCTCSIICRTSHVPPVNLNFRHKIIA